MRSQEDTLKAVMEAKTTPDTKGSMALAEAMLEAHGKPKYSDFGKAPESNPWSSAPAPAK